MTRRLILREEAELDVADAAHWYEDQRAGLGFRFLEALEQLFERVLEAPGQFPVVEDGVRRGLLQGFPYGAYFLPDQERVVVLAVLHLHRHPRAWRRRE